MTAALPPLLKGIASDDEIRTVLAGMPHNVTIEMDLALWRTARRAAPHRELLLRTSPGELAAAYLADELPDFGLAAFLDSYGHRCAAEVDVGVSRWSEDPAPVFAIIANYLRVTDPEQATDRRFERAAARSEAMLADLVRRARRKRPVRGRLAGFFLRRARELAGLREAGKFAGLYSLRDRRRRLLLIGAGLQAKGVLERATTSCSSRCPSCAPWRTAGRTCGRQPPNADRSTRESCGAVPVPSLCSATGPTWRRCSRLGRQAATRSPAWGRPPGGSAAPPEWSAIRRARMSNRARSSSHRRATRAGRRCSSRQGGLVTETGAVMAHGPTVAREYGIPTVICVPDATERIRTGQMVTVDGAAGTVTFDETATQEAVR